MKSRAMISSRNPRDRRADTVCPHAVRRRVARRFRGRADLVSRKFILKGDTTDHGGAMLDGIANSSFDGGEFACLGAPVFCAACKTRGVIVSDGGERTMTVMGKVVAREPDLCQCRCTPQPKLIPSQGTGTLSG